MPLGIDEIEEVVAAAVNAEAWFTHRECVEPLALDSDAYKVANELRGALGRVETLAPEMLEPREAPPVLALICGHPITLLVVSGENQYCELCETRKQLETVERELLDAQAGCIHCGDGGLVEIDSLLAYCRCPIGENLRLRAAVINHRSQRSDDRCWLDDQELYAVLGDGDLGDNRVGDKTAMLENCKRFLDQRCQAGGWKTYAEMEAERERLCDSVKPLLDWLGHFKDTGRQLGNLDMSLIDPARAALAAIEKTDK